MEDGRRGTRADRADNSPGLGLEAGLEAGEGLIVLSL